MAIQHNNIGILDKHKYNTSLTFEPLFNTGLGWGNI